MIPLFNSATSHHQSNSTPIASPPHPPPPSTLGVDSTVSKSSTSTLQDQCPSNYPISSGIDITFLEPVSKELPVRTKIYEFYNAPITKFWAYSGAFSIFLCIFTYVVLVKLPAFPQWPEWYVLAYISTYLTEKIREILSSEPAKLRQKLEVWSEKLWNIFDVIFTLLFLLGFALRLQDGDVRDAGRVILCVDIIYWYLKVLEILSANKYLGPLVMMMGKMIKNMAYFVILLLVVLMAFGVCRQSILFPNEEPHWRLARHIFYQPYFMLYGEVFAGDIDPPCGGPDEIDCQPGRWITPTVMSMYLLVANILLINLLIAVFNNIFTSVNAISHQVWMFQRFQVVMEFEEKPVFPPPLIILSHIHRTFKYFYYRNWKRKPFIYGHGLKRFLAGENLERVHDFEEECVDMYMREKDQKINQSTEERVRLVSERTEAVSQRLEDMHAKVVLALTSINNLDFHLKRLHEEVQEATSSYAIVHRFMVSHVGEPPTQRSSGSGTPSSGHLSPTPMGVDSQLSLQLMLQDSQRKMRQHPSEEEDDEEKEEEEEVQEEEEKDEEKIDTEEEETIQGRHGALVVKMNLNQVKKIEKKKVVKKKKKKEELETGTGKGKGDTRKRRRRSPGRKETTAETEEKVVEGGRAELRKSSLKKETKFVSPSHVSFQETRRESDVKTEGEGNRGRAFRRAYSHPEESSGAPIYTHAPSVAGGSRPRIQVIPPTTPPPVITFTAEYTSLGDELETVCMARLTPPASPRFFGEQRRNLHPRPRHRSDSSAPFDVYGHSNPLRDAEEADYHLMEGIIQRRMHRDSENLAISLEELCSIFSGVSEDEGEGDAEREGEGERGKGAAAAVEFRKRHSSASLDLTRSGDLSHSGASPSGMFHRQSPSPRRRSTLFGRGLYPLGSPTHDLQRRPGDDVQSWSPPVAQLATPERFSPRSSSPHLPPSGVPTSVSFLLQVPDGHTEEEGMPARPLDKVITETQC